MINKSYFSINELLNDKNHFLTKLNSILIIIFPIRITSTAPVEVIPTNPKIITSPFDGVVKEIVASNNDKVTTGDLLVLLEDIDLKNNFNLARQSLQIAEKELLRSRQFSFSNNEEKAKLAELAAQVDLKKTEVQSTSDKLKNSKLYADQDGIAIVDKKMNGKANQYL